MNTEFIKDLAAKIDALSERERLILTVAGVVFIWIVFQLLAFDAFAAQKKRITGDIQRLQNEAVTFDQSSTAILSAFNNNPNKPIQADIAALDTRIGKINEDLFQAKTELISPQKMAELLRKLLAANKRLTLVRLESLPTEPVALEAQEAANDDAEKQKAKEQKEKAAQKMASKYQLYRHSLLIELEGGFWDAQQYLQTIEQLPWRLYWQLLDYEVQEYPSARVEIRVHTYSTEEGWIGA